MSIRIVESCVFGSVLGEKIVLIGVDFLVVCGFLGGGSSNSESRNGTILGIYGSNCYAIVGVASTLGSVVCAGYSCTLVIFVSVILFIDGIFLIFVINQKALAMRY